MAELVYVVDPATNSPVGVTPASFAALDVRERRDLQGWVLAHPEILGEPLLIVTAEFDRFDKSSRRLDVLALDQDGVLVVIELKLDVAGSLADQQAIRYAAFCSTMTMAEVVQSFAQYRLCSEEDAELRIRDFLQSEELPELGNRPRIILAAGAMDDQELTSCVLWLRGFGLDITCVEVTPYQLPGSGQVVLVPRVIIPIPEARDYVISVERKEVVKAQEAKEKTAHTQLWAMVAEEYQRLHPRLTKLGAGRDYYLKISVGAKSLHYEWLLQKRKSQVSVAIHFESSDAEENYRRLSLVEQESAKITAGQTAPFHAERWGHQWASAGFSVPYVGKPDREIAKRCAEVMITLIDRTYPIIQSIIDSDGGTTPPAA